VARVVSRGAGGDRVCLLRQHQRPHGGTDAPGRGHGEAPSGTTVIMIVAAPGRVDIARMAAGPERHVIYPDGMPLRRLTTVARPVISNAVCRCCTCRAAGTTHVRILPGGGRLHYGYQSWLVGRRPPACHRTIGGHRLGGPDAAPIGHRWTRGPILRAWDRGRVPTPRSGRRRGDLTPTSQTCVQRARTGTNRAESLEQPLTTFRALWTPCSRFAPDKIPNP
jgi:hypothetical protein